MMKRLMCLGLLVLGFLPTACAMHSGATVSRSDMGQIQHLRKGVILSLHEVNVVGEQSGVGVGVGAVVGGLAGSEISEDEGTSTIAAIAGAVLGGLAGAKIEESAMGGAAIEFVVQPDDGQSFAVVQKNDENLGVGERVLIVESETTRIIRDQTSKSYGLEQKIADEKLARERLRLEEERKKLEDLRLAGENRKQRQEIQTPQKQVATLKAGTGVMLGESGYILTSYHLVRGMEQIRVKFVNGEEIDAPVFLKDEANDIAFLKLNRSPNISLMNIAMGDSSQMQIGNKVFTIGYPISNILGQKPKYSEGVINSLSGIKDNLGFFQVSAPIQSGNSGGPLFNQRGELVAMVSSSLDPENTFRVLGTMPQNVNFAVKSSLVKNMIPMLPETLVAPTGIVVVPTDTDSLQSFIKRVQNNIVLIEAKE